MRARRNLWLIVGGVLSAAAALLHLGVILGGPSWYRFFGAGEGMARMAELGSPTPALVTAAIAAGLAVWAAYAFAGAGLIRRLPLMRTALVTITAVYLLRGLMPLPILALAPEKIDSFTLWSSLIVLGYGIAYAVGTWRAWALLSMRAS
jgi:hypothetical protein